MTSSFNGFIVEINRNKLRVLSSDFETKETDLDPSIVTDTAILSLEGVSEKLKEILREFKLKHTKLIFLIEEKDIYDRFFVVRNDEENVVANLKSQASSFVGAPLDNLYCLYQKVSPFVYQFIGIKKELIDHYVKISENLKLKLEAILPTSFVFAKFVDSHDPFFFIFKGIDESTLVASEYGGVYFSGTYKASSEVNSKMTSLVNDLSTFNREKPVTKLIYVGDSVIVDSRFSLEKKEIPLDVKLDDYKGFERLLITLSLLTKNYGEVVLSYFNLKGFLEGSSGIKSTSLVKYVVPALAVSSIALVLVLFSSGKLQLPSRSHQLPEVDGAKESSPSVLVQEEEPKESSSTPMVLDKSKLKIRVENGAGIAGTAGKAKDFLVPLGYSVVEVGNAERFDYQETEVQIKVSKKEYLEVLKVDLGKNYKVSMGKDLAEDKSYDVLIIAGRK